MKKLLLLGAVLVVGATAFAHGGGDGSGNIYDRGISILGDYDGGAIEAGYASPKQQKVGGSDNDLLGFAAVHEFGISDNQNDTAKNGNRVNLFRGKGEGWSDTAETRVRLTVIEKVAIYAENKTIKIDAVKGDQVAIGDIMFKVTGAADTKITFDFKPTEHSSDGSGHGRSLFSDVSGRTKIMEIGGANMASNNNFEQLVMSTGPKEKGKSFSKEFEVDLYFDLSDVEAGRYCGDILATAIYE